VPVWVFDEETGGQQASAALELASYKHVSTRVENAVNKYAAKAKAPPKANEGKDGRTAGTMQSYALFVCLCRTVRGVDAWCSK